MRLFYFHLPCCAFILFSLTLLCVYFIFTYPAMRLFYFHLPCCDIIFRLPLIFLRTPAAILFFAYPAVQCAFIFLRAYPAVPLPCCNSQDFFGSVCIADNTDN